MATTKKKKTDQPILSSNEQHELRTQCQEGDVLYAERVYDTGEETRWEEVLLGIVTEDGQLRQPSGKIVRLIKSVDHEFLGSKAVLAPSGDVQKHCVGDDVLIRRGEVQDFTSDLGSVRDVDTR